MRKLSSSENYGDKTVRSDLSHSGYVTVDDEVELPNYLVLLPSQNDVVMEIYTKE